MRTAVLASSVARYAGNFVPAAVFATDPDTLGLWHFDEVAGPATLDAVGVQHGLVSPEAVRVVANG